VAAGGVVQVLGATQRRTLGKRRSRWLVARLAVTVVLAALLANAAAMALEHYLTGLVLNQVTERALDHVDVGVLPHVDDADFEPPYTPDKLDDIDSRLDPLLARARQGGSGIIRLTVNGRDGTILYSDLAGLRGKVVSPVTDELARSALGGTPSAALVSVLGGLTTADLVDHYNSALEADVPVVMNGAVVGVYELYQDPAPLYALRPFIWALGLATGVIFLALMRVAPRLVQHPVPARAGQQRRPTSDSDLTRREIQVLQLLAQGGTYRTIGEQLVISEETVRTHVKSILHKLGEPNRANAVTAARKAGLVT
jgi:DNA-binding CsgD family transcriptional regulator